MPRVILDTSVLVAFWRAQEQAAKQTPLSEEVVRSWAAKLLKDHRHDHPTRPVGIVTPVALEFIGGGRSKDEVRLYKAFLAEFRLVDEGHILDRDWQLAQHYAERVPGGRRKNHVKAAARHLGDCLIRALADRLNCDVKTLDKHFPF